jgi:hypothetical protein
MQPNRPISELWAFHPHLENRNHRDVGVVISSPWRRKDSLLNH